jgi:hypothetical protein
MQETKELDILEAFSTPNKAMEFLNTQILPKIKEIMNVHSVWKIFFENELIPQGQIVSFSKETPPVIYINDKEEAVVLSKDNLIRDVAFPTEFMITSTARVPMSDIYLRVPNIPERIIDKISKELYTKKDNYFKSLLDKSVEINKDIITFGKWKKFVSFITRKNLLDVFEKALKKLGKCYTMNYLLISVDMIPVFQTLIYKYGSELALKDFQEGRLFGLKIVVWDFPGDDSIYLLPKVKIGKKLTRISLQTLPADQFVNAKVEYGFMVVQQESMSIIKSDSVYKIIIK